MTARRTQHALSPIGNRLIRVAIVGSRHLTDYREFCALIRPYVHRDSIIVSGRSPGGGIDLLAARFAKQNGHQLIEHPIDDARVSELQSEHPRDRAFAIAAHERNQRIVDELTGDRDCMLAIKCPHSTDTLDTIARMRKHLELASGEHSMRLLVWLLACGR
jgi:hypothetical protein